MVRHIYFETIDSTNLEAKRQIEQGGISGHSVIYANQQTAGQGSRGRVWDSSKIGNIAASFIFPIESNDSKPHLAVYPIALAIREFIEDLISTSEQIHIKWPNDLLINEKKVCGCLHEIYNSPGQRFFIAGIGINLKWHPEADNATFPATSLAEYLSIDKHMPHYIDLLGAKIEKYLDLWKKKDMPYILHLLIPTLYKLNETISVRPHHNKSHRIEGIFESIDENGALILLTPSGRQKFTTADIFPTLG